SSPFEPLSTTVMAQLGYGTLCNDSRHSMVSCSPFQFRMMILTLGWFTLPPAAKAAQTPSGKNYIAAQLKRQTWVLTNVCRDDTVSKENRSRSQSPPVSVKSICIHIEVRVWVSDSIISWPI